MQSARPQRADQAVVVAVTVDELRPLKPGPVSVFISRKEGRVFVRQGLVLLARAETRGAGWARAR